MKPFFRRTLPLLLLLALLAALSVAPLQRSALDNSRWLTALEDSRPITSLSIPGTHDSGALYSFADVFGKCQTLPIGQQLTAGVRFLDLRLRLVEDRLMVYHNFVDQRASFVPLLETLTDFLRENPGEFLLVSFKEEEDPLRSTLSFPQALEAELARYPQVIAPDSALPETLGQARGKLYVLARYDGATLGIPAREGWQNNAAFRLGELYIQDCYKLSSTEEKYPAIRSAWEVAAQADTLTLNFTSCYLTGTFPPSYAGTPARQINRWLARELPGTQGPLGILACDFITADLAAAIIGRNDP